MVSMLFFGDGRPDDASLMRAARLSAGNPGHFLAALDGSCRTPIAGLATVDGDAVSFRGMILRTDGSEVHETSRQGAVADAERLGADAGRELKTRGGPDFFTSG